MRKDLAKIMIEHGSPERLERFAESLGKQAQRTTGNISEAMRMRSQALKMLASAWRQDIWLEEQGCQTSSSCSSEMSETERSTKKAISHLLASVMCLLEATLSCTEVAELEEIDSGRTLAIGADKLLTASRIKTGLVVAMIEQLKERSLL